MSGFDFVSYRLGLRSRSRSGLRLKLRLKLRPRPNPVLVVLEFCTPIRLYVCINVLNSNFVCLNCVVYCSVFLLRIVLCFC